jgi:hypothetical protein
VRFGESHFTGAGVAQGRLRGTLAGELAWMRESHEGTGRWGVALIRSRGHFPRGGYDVDHGGQATEAGTSKLHG